MLLSIYSGESAMITALKSLQWDLRFGQKYWTFTIRVNWYRHTCKENIGIYVSLSDCDFTRFSLTHVKLFTPSFGVIDDEIRSILSV